MLWGALHLQAKRKRIRMMSDDEDSDKEADKEQNEREVIEKELFEGEDDEEPREQEERPQIPDTIEEDLEHSGEESGMSDQNFNTVVSIVVHCLTSLTVLLHCTVINYEYSIYAVSIVYYCTVQK